MSLTHWLLEVDGGTLTRGRAYAREGRVDVVRRTGGQLVAVVAGTTPYDVTISAEHTFCTCPIGMRGDLCKHVAAVLLADDGGDDRAPVPTDGSTPTRKTPLADGELDELVASLRTRGYLDWRRANEHGEHAHRVADRLEETLDRDNADRVRAALERAVPAMVRSILRSDDSSGIQGDATVRLLDLHARAANLGSPDPLRLARWIAKVGLADDGFLEIDPVPYAEPLNTRGLAAYTREVDRRLAADRRDFSAGLARQRLAVLSGDIDRIIDEVGGALHAPYDYQCLVDALLEVGAKDQALHYARHGAGLTGAWHQTGFLTDVAVRLLEERRDAGAAVELRRHHLRAAPNLSSFTALRRTATSAGSWPAERIDALDVLLAHNPDDWLRALLADGDPDLAWEASRSMEVPRSLRLQLVRARAQTHPDQVHDDYVAIIDDTLTDARPDNYREAVKLLGELRRASEVGRRVEEYDAYVAILIERHRPRPTLVEKLAAMPPARPA